LEDSVEVNVNDELATASDAMLADAIEHADPLILRGLLYQLTGDETLASMPVETVVFGYSQQDRLANPDDVELVRSKTVAWLKDLRDRSARQVSIGPVERLPRSLELIAGTRIPERELPMWIEETGLDPLARGLTWKGQPTPEQRENFFVVVIGAGISGINAAVQLKSAGIPFVVIEKNAGVGGTWFENRYPGIRVDSPSRGYLHLFGLEYPQPYSFCPGEENVRYMDWVVEKYGLADHILFDTEVRSMIWDENGKAWEVDAVSPDGPRRWTSNAVISCVGFLSRPKIAHLEGIETFDGVVTHTAQWPSDLDITGKRVGIVGTGASGYQTTPVIAKSAAHTSLFQRTPSWCYPTPGYVAPLPEATVWVDRHVPFYVNFARFRMGRMYGPDTTLPSMMADPDYDDPHARSAANKAMREGCIAFITATLGHRPDLMEKMIPVAPPMTSRPIRVDPEDNVYTALLRDDVSLVSDPIERVTPDGIIAGGVEHPLDVIVLATGFRANDFLWPMEIRGRGGARPEELWAKDGPRAYIGSMMPGFPNLFMAYGPNTNNFGGLQVIDLLELEIRFALQCIAGLIENGQRSVEVTEDAYWRYNQELDEVERHMIYKDPRVSNYYQNEHGRSSVNGPIDIRRMWNWLRDPAGPPKTEIDAGLEPWFGADLVVT
jgi:4-hydroxyacetophenone monooxygenase